MRGDKQRFHDNALVYCLIHTAVLVIHFLRRLNDVTFYILHIPTTVTEKVSYTQEMCHVMAYYIVEVFEHVIKTQDNAFAH